MSDDLNKQERAVKSILQGAQFEPQMDGLWDRVEAQLEEQKPRRRFALLWWSLGLLVLVSSSAAVGYMWRSATVTEVASMASNNLHGKNQTSNVNSLLAEEALTDETPSIEVTGTEVPSEGGLTNDRPHSVTMTQQHATNQNKINTVTKLSDSYVDISSGTTPQSTSNLDLQNIAIDFVPVTTPENSKSEEDGSTIEEHKATQLKEMPLMELQVTPIQMALSKAIFEDRSDWFPTPVTPVGKSVQRYYVTLRAGATHGYSAISQEQPIDGFDMDAFDRERDQLGLSVAFDIGRHLGNWRVFSGLSVNETVTRYKRTGTDVTTGSQIGTAYIYIDDEGNSSFVEGEIDVATATNYDQQWHRRHRMIDVHLGIGRELLSFGNFSFGMDVLGGYNLATSHSGYQFAVGEEVLQKLQPGQESVYRKNIGLSAAILGHLTFHMQNVDISLVPVWRKQFTPFTNTNNIYQIKNSQLGLQLGITYKPRWK